MTQLLRDKLVTRRGPEDIVLDPFLAVWSTLMAAERTGRTCRGIEIDPLYVDIAIRRWQPMTGERAIHAESGVAFAALKLEETEARHDR
jgi:DNA modification methylase